MAQLIESREPHVNTHCYSQNKAEAEFRSNGTNPALALPLKTALIPYRLLPVLMFGILRYIGIDFCNSENRRWRRNVN
jgi:hypothetical protein